MTTFSAVILQALKVSGVVGQGQAAAQSDLDDALFQVNAMLGQWARKRWLNPDLMDVSFTSTGASSYSIGPNCDIPTPRPDKIESAFVRLNGGISSNVLVDSNGLPLLDSNGLQMTDGSAASIPRGAIDYPLEILDAREDYNAISLKGLQSFPSCLFYDSAYPSGNVYIWPIPAGATYQIHLSLKVGIPQVVDPSLDIGLPPEYVDAMLWTLAARLRPVYGMPPEPTISAAMRAALNTIRVANTQIPLLHMPAELAGRRTGGSNGVALFAGSSGGGGSFVLGRSTLG